MHLGAIHGAAVQAPAVTMAGASSSSGGQAPKPAAYVADGRIERHPPRRPCGDDDDPPPNNGGGSRVPGGNAPPGGDPGGDGGDQDADMGRSLASEDGRSVALDGPYDTAGSSLKVKEAEKISLPALPHGARFREWRRRVREQVCGASGRPDERFVPLPHGLDRPALRLADHCGP